MFIVMLHSANKQISWSWGYLPSYFSWIPNSFSN